MGSDDLLCSRNARSRTPLVGRAQSRINQATPSSRSFRPIKIDKDPAILFHHPFRGFRMDMLMIVFRTSLKEPVHELLRVCGVKAYTEFPKTAGTGQSGTTEGLWFSAGDNSVIFVSLESAQRDKVGDAVKAWCAEAQHSGWDKPAIRIFSWPCTQLI